MIIRHFCNETVSCKLLFQDTRGTQRILGEGGNLAYAYGPQVQFYQTIPGSQTLRRVHYPPDHTVIQTYATPIRHARPPEMIIQNDFRKVSGISPEMYRQIEAVEKQYDAATASQIEAVERRGEMILRLLDPRFLGRAGVDTHRKYLSTSVNGQQVQFVEIIKRPGQTLGLYIREGDGITASEGVFISRIAPESPIYNSGVLKIGDEILAVNLVDVRRMSLDDVVIVMSIPRRLVLTIRSRLYRQGVSPATTMKRQDEYRAPPIVVVKKEMEDEPFGMEDMMNRDNENGHLMEARMKGVPLGVPSVVVPLESQGMYDDSGLYYNSRGAAPRNILRPMTHARDDTYVQIYQKAADARTRTGGGYAGVIKQNNLQRVYPRTIDNLAEEANAGYSSDGLITSRRAGTLSRMDRPPLGPRSGRMSAASHRSGYWDEVGTASLRRGQLRPGSALGILPTGPDDFLPERYNRPLSRTSLRSGTPTGYRLAPMHDSRGRIRYDDLRSSLSSQALAGLRSRRGLIDGSASDTEAAAVKTYGLKHRNLTGRYSRMSGRSSVTDALRTGSLPRHGYSRHPGHTRRSHSRAGVAPSAAARFGRHAFMYDDDSDGAASAPEVPGKPPRRLLSKYLSCTF